MLYRARLLANTSFYGRLESDPGRKALVRGRRDGDSPVVLMDDAQIAGFRRVHGKGAVEVLGPVIAKGNGTDAEASAPVSAGVEAAPAPSPKPVLLDKPTTRVTLPVKAGKRSAS